MIRSLFANCDSAVVFVLCMDDYTLDAISSKQNDRIVSIPLRSIESNEVLSVKSNRSVAEYCWTLSSVFTWYILSLYEYVNLITYLDADIFFFSDVSPIFNEIDKSSIAIVEHRFTPRLSDRIVNGRFCVQWCSFRRDPDGISCLKRWRNQCLDWCYYRLEDGKMGDQKYLDSWPDDYSSCHVVQNLGAGLAPWNYAQYKISYDIESSIILVNDYPLIFYHFHQFQLLSPNRSSRLSSFYTEERAEPDEVYSIYEKEVFSIIRELQKKDPAFIFGFVDSKTLWFRRAFQAIPPLWLKDFYRAARAKVASYL